MMQRIGIIGGGLMGAAVGYYLAEAGAQVTILEQGQELGGINAPLQFPGGLVVARYQQAVMPTDRALADLCAALGLEDDLVYQSARAGFVNQGRVHPLSNLLEFLAFPMLRLTDRVRLGRMIWRARGEADWQALDKQPARDWLMEVGGAEPFERIWRPLLEAKFDWVYDNVSAAYVWAWLNRMTATRQVPQLDNRVGYLRRGLHVLIQRLANALEARGGQIQFEQRVREIEINDSDAPRVRTYEGWQDFDQVVVTLPTPVVARLLTGAQASFVSALEQSRYLGLICPVMVVDQPLSSYWTLHMTDPSFPFATIVETPHPDQPGLHVVYLPRFTAPDNDWMGVSDEDIREAWLSHLRLIFPAFDRSQIRHFAVSRSRYVEPIYRVNMLQSMLPVQTPYEGLFLVNSEQVYPDLPTTDAFIRHAHLAAQLIGQPRRQTTSAPLTH